MHYELLFYIKNPALGGGIEFLELRRRGLRLPVHPDPLRGCTPNSGAMRHFLKAKRAEND